MKKIFVALMLVAASLNIAACTTHAAVDSSSSEMADRTAEAQTASNDSLRK
jgi:hypothetical protein